MAHETETKTLPQLEPKQIAIAEYVLRGKTQREAYKLAHYKAVKDEVIDTVASEILRNPQVAEYLEIRKAELREKLQYTTGVSVERTTREIARIAYFDPKDLYDEQGRFLHPAKMPEHVRACIASIKCEPVTGLITEIKFWNKPTSNDQLCKIQAMYAAEKVEVNHTFEAMLSQLKPSNN